MATGFEDLGAQVVRPAPTTGFEDLGARVIRRSTPAGAFGRSALESLLPSAAGFGAVSAVLAAVPTGGASLLAIPAGLAAGFGASKLQDVAARTIDPQGREAFVRQRAQDIAQHPVAATAGEVLPSLLALKPGIPRTIPMLRTAAISGAIQGGLEAGSEAVQGQPLNPARIATQAAAGATLTRPTAIGRRLGFPDAPVKAAPAEPPPAPHVQRIIEAVESAKPIRGQQEALFTAERGKRLARMMGVRESVQGEAGFHAELGQLKGELPKVQFEAVRPVVEQPHIDALFNDVNASSLAPWDQLTAKTGLAKLLQPEGGQVPTRGELSALNEVFGERFTTAVMKKRPQLQQFGEKILSGANLPRALMATLDLSAPLRQGVFLIGRPKQWLPAFGNMFRQFASEKYFKASQEQIRSRPTYPLMQQARLALTDTGPILQAREEIFMSRLAERLPGVRQSNRAYVGFVNRLRADVFDDLVAKGKKLGVSEDPTFLSSVGSFVNAATGRGSLGAFERSSTVLNTLFFSPRLMASRLSLLNPAYYVRLHPTVRKEALASLFTFASAGASVLGLAKLAGAQVGGDPRSADFGKIRVGNTRYDIWGGFQQYIRSASQLITGKYISTTTGREITLGEGYKPLTRKEILSRQVESKSAPVLSFILNWLEGQSFGQPFRPSSEFVDRFIPMALQDMYDLAQEDGLAGIPKSLPALFGTGVQTYGDLIPMIEQTRRGAETLRFRQTPTLGERTVNAVTGRQVSNVPTAFHRELGQLQRQAGIQKADVERAVRLTKDDGQRRRVGNVMIWRDRGVVHTKRFGANPTPKRRLEQLLGRRLQQ